MKANVETVEEVQEENWACMDVTEKFVNREHGTEKVENVNGDVTKAVANRKSDHRHRR